MFTKEKERINDIAAQLGLPINDNDTFPLITLIEETARRVVLIEKALDKMSTPQGGSPLDLYGPSRIFGDGSGKALPPVPPTFTCGLDLSGGFAVGGKVVGQALPPVSAPLRVVGPE